MLSYEYLPTTNASEYSEVIVRDYYMASGQDESNPTRAGKMELPCPLGTTRHVPQGTSPESHIPDILNR